MKNLATRKPIHQHIIPFPVRIWLSCIDGNQLFEIHVGKTAWAINPGIKWQLYFGGPTSLAVFTVL